MANFIAVVYATLKEAGIETKDLSTDEAIKKYEALRKAEKKYNDDPEVIKQKLNGDLYPKNKETAGQEDDKRDTINKKRYTRRLDSAVMYKYSSVRRLVEKRGYAIVEVHDGINHYWIRINKSSDDFDYDIIRKF